MERMNNLWVRKIEPTTNATPSNELHALQMDLQYYQKENEALKRGTILMQRIDSHSLESSAIKKTLVKIEEDAKVPWVAGIGISFGLMLLFVIPVELFSSFRTNSK